MTTDIEFEQVIIKALYANSDVSSKVVPELNSDWFINLDHKYIVNAISDYNARFSAMPNVIEMRRLLSDERTVPIMYLLNRYGQCIFCNKKCWKYEKKIVLLQSALTTPDTIDEVLLTISLSTN